MADVSPKGVVQWKSGDGSRRPAPPSAWLKNGVGGSSGADAARYLLLPPLIQPVELNNRVAALARERGWNPCKLSSDQRLALVKEVLDSLPKPVPPEPAQPKPPTPSEQHAADLLERRMRQLAARGNTARARRAVARQGLTIPGIDGEGDHGAVEDQSDSTSSAKEI